LKLRNNAYLSKYLLIDILAYAFPTSQLLAIMKMINHNLMRLSIHEEELAKKMSYENTNYVVDIRHINNLY
jgi:hypothetical protein